MTYDEKLVASRSCSFMCSKAAGKGNLDAVRVLLAASADKDQDGDLAFFLPLSSFIILGDYFDVHAQSFISLFLK